MDATSSYKAATLVKRPSVSSIEDIYANATSLQTSPTGLSDDAMESAQGLGGGAGNRVNNIYIFLMSGSTLTIARNTINEGAHNLPWEKEIYKKTKKS